MAVLPPELPCSTPSSSSTAPPPHTSSEDRAPSRGCSHSVAVGGFEDAVCSLRAVAGNGSQSAAPGHEAGIPKVDATIEPLSAALGSPTATPTDLGSQFASVPCASTSKEPTSSCPAVEPAVAVAENMEAACGTNASVSRTDVESEHTCGVASPAKPLESASEPVLDMTPERDGLEAPSESRFDTLEGTVRQEASTEPAPEKPAHGKVMHVPEEHVPDRTAEGPAVHVQPELVPDVAAQGLAMDLPLDPVAHGAVPEAEAEPRGEPPELPRSSTPAAQGPAVDCASDLPACGAAGAPAVDPPSQAVLDSTARGGARKLASEPILDVPIPEPHQDSEATAKRRACLEQLKAKRATRLLDPDLTAATHSARDVLADQQEDNGQNPSTRRVRIPERRARRESKADDDACAVSSDPAGGLGCRACELREPPASRVETHPQIPTAPQTHSAARQGGFTREAQEPAASEACPPGEEMRDNSPQSISYADFWQQQRRGATNAAGPPKQRGGHAAVATEPAPTGSRSVAGEQPQLDIGIGVSERSVRIERIQELRRARGADPMPVLDPALLAGPNSYRVQAEAAGKLSVALDSEDPVNAENASVDEDLRDDEAAPSKKVVILLADSAKVEAEACRSEPEPELQVDAEQELAPGQAVAARLGSSSTALAAAQLHVGLVATQDMVDDLRLRWQRYCSGDGQRQESFREPATLPAGDALFEELQARWREVRGVSSTDLRPELRALVAPIEVQKVRFGSQAPGASTLPSPRLEQVGTPRSQTRSRTEPQRPLDVRAVGTKDAPHPEGAMPPYHSKAGITLPPASPRWPVQAQQDLSTKAHAKVSSAVVPLPAVGLHEQGRQPAAGVEAAAALHHGQLPRERQQIDDNCVHQ
uniref:Uncharacterized protein n=1 Tax=Pyrodinium bahamense TaxID=73915 RepID=A0A7S0FLV1_9DINO